VYPPQLEEICASNNSTVGKGVCGINGNTKLFEADQTATNCSSAGNIEGPYQGIFYTTTQLIGDDTVLYQVTLDKDVFPQLGLTEDQLTQNQLTTIVTAPDGTTRRTRTAQGFTLAAPGTPSYASFYRETKVSKAVFYEQLRATLDEYNVLWSDVCAWQDNSYGLPSYVGSHGINACKAHLQESFQL